MNPWNNANSHVNQPIMDMVMYWNFLCGNVAVLDAVYVFIPFLFFWCCVCAGHDE
jgi:hypothetical protein